MPRNRGAGEDGAIAAYRVDRHHPDQRYRRAAGAVHLFLDDYHVITERMIYELMDRLIRYLPTQMHLVLCCRTDPPIPLSLLRGRQQINELRLNDLRFSIEEAKEFLEQTNRYRTC